MSRRLGLKNVYFHKKDIFDMDGYNVYDIVANIGGLYHVQDRVKALDISYRYCKKYLIVQTVVSLENEDEDYFVTPEPHWTWGCRFSRAWFDKAIADKGGDIIVLLL